MVAQLEEHSPRIREVIVLDPVAKHVDRSLRY